VVVTVVVSVVMTTDTTVVNAVASTNHGGS